MDLLNMCVLVIYNACWWYRCDDWCIYIYCLLQWNVKKIAILGVFAECHGQGTRQRFFKKYIYNFFAECLAAALGKVFFFKKIQKFFAECLNRGTRQRNYLKKNFAECLDRGTRQSNLKKKKTLPSAWAGALGKVIFKKNKFFFCRVLGQPLGKTTVNGECGTAENILPSAAPSTR